MMLFDVPTMPLLRRVQLTSISGNTTCALIGAAVVVSASAAPTNLAICPFPMTPRSFVCVRANGEHIGEDQARCEESKPDTDATSRRPHLRKVVGDAALTAFAPALPSPLRKTAPYGHPVHRLGDCAGRSPGSRVVAQLRQAFPVSQWPLDAGSPLTVAGAATDVVKFEGSNLSCPCSLFRPRPSRGTSTSKCSPRTPQGVK